VSNSPISAEVEQRLVKMALAARQHAYADYSHYLVGAALLAASGQIFTGCNVENAAYPAGICAERTAVVKAVSEGVREWIAIAVATENGGSPCGICRQVLNEFAPDIWVIVVDESGTVHYRHRLGELLPHSFSPTNLKGRQT
jgi:cytidine deaminase